LTYLFNTMASGDPGWFTPAIPVELRLRAARGTASLFEKLFLPRCAPILSHLDEHGGHPLNPIPSLALADDPARAVIDDATLTAMEMILALDSIACQESSLHGFGHSQPRHTTRVRDIINTYVAAPHSHRLDPYAEAARCVL
jgi:hypothetical protein